VAAKSAAGARFARLDDSTVTPKAEPRLIGYARVSTDEQTTALQLDALRAAGCAVIHEDSASGGSRSRPGLHRALEDLCASDTLVVWRLDRLGRSLRDLLDISETLQERDVALRSLTDHIDTGTAAGRMLYAVLGAVAQFERDVLRERTVAGMRAAKKRGEHIGRPPVLSPAQVREAKEDARARREPEPRRTRLTRRPLDIVSCNRINSENCMLKFRPMDAALHEPRSSSASSSLLAALDLVLRFQGERGSAQPLLFFFALGPKVDVPHDVQHEHFPIVALRTNQEVAEILNLILAVGDRDVFARARYIDVQPTARLS